MIGPADALAYRERCLRHTKRIVVKVGSSLLATSPVGQPAMIADEFASLDDAIEIIIVSSGAIALGLPIIGFNERPTDLSLLQAAAAIGQSRLLQHWEQAFAVYQRHIAQILVTHGDLSNKERRTNTINVLQTLLRTKTIPIINENDTIATDEITFGDNDKLAAQVCNLVSADVLIIYSDVNGLHDAEPRLGGTRIPIVTDIKSQAIPSATTRSASGLGRGGMASKVVAAKHTTSVGIPTVVVPGNQRHVLRKTLDCQDLGTLFVPSTTSLPAQNSAKPA